MNYSFTEHVFGEHVNAAAHQRKRDKNPGCAQKPWDQWGQGGRSRSCTSSFLCKTPIKTSWATKLALPRTEVEETRTVMSVGCLMWTGSSKTQKNVSD